MSRWVTAASLSFALAGTLVPGAMALAEPGDGFTVADRALTPAGEQEATSADALTSGEERGSAVIDATGSASALTPADDGTPAAATLEVYRRYAPEEPYDRSNYFYLMRAGDEGTGTPLVDILNTLYAPATPYTDSDEYTLQFDTATPAPVVSIARDASGRWMLSAAAGTDANCTIRRGTEELRLDFDVCSDHEAADAWLSLMERCAVGGTVTLQQDYSCPTPMINGALTVPEGIEVTLDLNGHTINRNTYIEGNGSGRSYAAAIVRGTLAVEDSVGGGSIRGGGPLYGSGYGGGIVVDGGSFSLRGGSLADNNSYGVRVLRGSFEMSGGSIVGRESMYMTAVRVDEGASFTMTGGTIEKFPSHSKDNNTGAVYVEGGSFTMGGTAALKDNDSNITVSVWGSSASFTMDGGEIVDNLGEGVEVQDGATFTMNGGSIERNTMGANVVISSFVMNGGTIAHNKSKDPVYQQNLTAGVRVNGAGAQFSISGDATVADNVNNADQPSNVGIAYGGTIKVLGPMTNTTPIGLHLASDVGVFTEGYAAHNSDGPWLHFENEMGDGRHVLWNADRTEAKLGQGCQVSFDEMGGTEVEDEWVEEGQTLPRPADPTRTGYHFVGWFSDSELTQPFVFSEDSQAEASGQGLSGQAGDADAGDADAGGAVPVGPGSLSLVPQADEQVTIVTSDLTLYAKWAPNTYAVRFDPGASGTTGTMADQVLTYDEEAVLEKNAFVREGHSFVGWNTVADGSGDAYGDGASVTNLASEQDAVYTLHAQWEIHRHTVAFDTRGGTSVDSQTVDYGTTPTRPTDPSRSGYRFAGWCVDEALTQPYAFDTPITADLTLHAKWDSIPADDPSTDGGEDEKDEDGKGGQTPDSPEKPTDPQKPADHDGEEGQKPADPDSEKTTDPDGEDGQEPADPEKTTEPDGEDGGQPTDPDGKDGQGDDSDDEDKQGPSNPGGEDGSGPSADTDGTDGAEDKESDGGGERASGPTVPDSGENPSDDQGDRPQTPGTPGADTSGGEGGSSTERDASVPGADAGTAPRDAQSASGRPGTTASRSATGSQSSVASTSRSTLPHTGDAALPLAALGLLSTSALLLGAGLRKRD